ncbi:2OG-Fe(II) oxygenase family protein [Ceratobasidium sp. AG-Ba]|nr:2OG-Fe(II) oxygenase family protein [Ceratobasidium sp. AG-Ba]
MLDTSSKEYKKALRHHRKSEQHKAHDGRSEPLSAFRAAEKKYKARFPPPDLDQVLDLAPDGEVRGRTDAVKTKEIGLKGGKKGYLVERIPGLVLLPSFVSPSAQQSLVARCLREHARSPNESNLDAHYLVPPAGLWNEWEKVAKHRQIDPGFDVVIDIKWKDGINADQYHPPDTERTLVNNATGSAAFATKSQPKLEPMPSSSLQPTPVSALISKLRWSNIGLNYHWGTKSYDFDRQKVPFPDDIRDICVDAVRNVDWRDVWEGVELADGLKWDDGEDWIGWEHTYEPDAGIINFYQPKDTLMGHVDRSEISSTSPLVSISYVVVVSLSFK